MGEVNNQNETNSTKRLRGINFSPEEKSILVEIVMKPCYKQIIFMKKIDKESIKLKEEAWQNVFEEYNSNWRVQKRTLKQLKCLLDNLKKRNRKESHESHNNVCVVSDSECRTVMQSAFEDTYTDQISGINNGADNFQNVNDEMTCSFDCKKEINGNCLDFCDEESLQSSTTKVTGFELNENSNDMTDVSCLDDGDEIFEVKRAAHVTMNGKDTANSLQLQSNSSLSSSDIKSSCSVQRLPPLIRRNKERFKFNKIETARIHNRLANYRHNLLRLEIRHSALKFKKEMEILRVKKQNEILKSKVLKAKLNYFKKKF